MDAPRIPRTGLGLRDIFSQAYRSQTLKAAGDRELTPVESMLLRSQGVDLVRQYLPSWAGGYRPGRMQGFDVRRFGDDRNPGDEDFRTRTLRVGDYPGVDISRQGPAAEAARRTAQAAGALTADLTTQGAQNIWWFINAFQAASSAAGQQAMHGALGPNRLLRRPGIPDAPMGAPFSRSNYTVGATFPLVVGASAAVGNLFRQPGYTAVLPSEEDRRQSENALGEVALRGIGMTGRLLPYEDFVQERPDVSRGEYEAYKAFLYGSPMPLKFNADGVHGAEVNLLGRSIPLLTGVLPVAGGVIGGAVGLRMAGKRLAGLPTGGKQAASNPNQFRALNTKEYEVSRLRSALGDPDLDPGAAQQLAAQLNQAKLDHVNQLNRVEDTLLLGALGGSSLGLGLTAAGSQLLEQVRRARNTEENRRREQEPPAAPGAPAPRA
jgi:hypothetical protein